MDPETVKTLATAGGIAAGMGPTAKAIAERMFGPSLDAVGQHFGDRVKAYLNRNATATAEKAAEQVAASGKEPHEIPLRTAIPLLEGASREDDASLREMWAALMANASIAESPDSVPPYFANMLGQMTPIEAELLVAISGARELVDRHRDMQFGGSHYTPPGYTEAYLIGYEKADRDRRSAGVDLLIGLGLVVRDNGLPVVQAFGDMSGALHVRQPDAKLKLTALGVRFLLACSAPEGGTL
jgi:hypothetical protein